jgi:hypothetical protein
MFRKRFVANSSSSSFFIENLTDEEKSFYDFCVENMELLHEYNHEYVYPDMEFGDYVLKKDFLESSKNINVSLKPGSNVIELGDHAGITERILELMLRNSEKSKNFKWRLEESYH